MVLAVIHALADVVQSKDFAGVLERRRADDLPIHVSGVGVLRERVTGVTSRSAVTDTFGRFKPPA